MMPDINAARSLCLVNEAEESLLKSPQSPIVLLKKRPEAVFATGLADGLPELGVMLPYTPIQHLLAHDFAGMLVMTSANIHDEPIVTDDCDAYRKLGDVADAFLGHNRAIEQRYDELTRNRSSKASFLLSSLRGQSKRTPSALHAGRTLLSPSI